MTIVNLTNYGVNIVKLTYAFILKKNKSSKIHRIILINDKKEKEIKKIIKKNTNKILYTSSSSINGFNQSQFMKETFLLFHSFGR